MLTRSDTDSYSGSGINNQSSDCKYTKHYLNYANFSAIISSIIKGRQS